MCGYISTGKHYIQQFNKEISRIENYVKESGSGLTKEQYFEMCEMMGSEPLEEEIPCSREDLTLDTQLIFNIYDKLPAKWEGFSGQYLGKDLLLLDTLFKHYKLEEYEESYAWDIIPIIDSFVAEDIARKIKSKTKVAGDTPGGNH